MNQHPKILVGCPTYDGKGYCLDKYADAVKGIDYDGYDVLLVDNSETDAYYERLKKMGIQAWRLNEKGLSARERITSCRNALRKITIENYDYFLSLEQDVIPPKDIIQKLLRHGKKIVSAVYNMKMENGEYYPLLWKFLEENELEQLKDKNQNLKKEIESINSKKTKFCSRYSLNELPKNSLIRVAACGLGAVLIHKDVLAKIFFRANEVSYDDMFFCQDSVFKGFEIFADTSVICEHFQDPS